MPLPSAIAKTIGQKPSYGYRNKSQMPFRNTNFGLALGFYKPNSNHFVFVDECHRTQSGDLHKAMKDLLPNAVFVGFTGTPPIG